MVFKEFFNSLAEAEAWAQNNIKRVIAVYGLDKRGTARQFKIELGDSESYGMRHSGARAVVLFVR